MAGCPAQVLRPIQVVQQRGRVAPRDLARHRHRPGRTRAAHRLGHALDRRGAKTARAIGELDAGEEDAKPHAFDGQGAGVAAQTLEHGGVQVGEQTWCPGEDSNLHGVTR